MFVKNNDSVRIEECSFYHSIDIPGYGRVEGEWDLGGKQREYLGSFNFKNKSVIEFGPSSGGITFFITKECSSLVAFEISDDCNMDILPLKGRNKEGEIDHSKKMNSRFKNAWMFARKAFESKARAYYGNIYSIPNNIGPFDVAVFASILLHLRDPFKPLEDISKQVTESIIVTELLWGGAESETDSIMKFNPGNSVLSWWGLSPAAVIKMLEILDFPNIELKYHSQKIYKMDENYLRDSSNENSNPAMFTVIGRRC